MPGNIFDQFDAPQMPSAPDPYVVQPNPMRVRQQQEGVESARISNRIDAATAPAQIRKSNAEAAKAEADATKAQRDLEAQQATVSPEQQRAMASLADDEVLAAIQRARDGVNAGYSAGYWARLGQVPVLGGLIAPQNAVDLEGSLNTIASRLTLDKLAQLKQSSPTGASGLGSLTEKEGALLRDSVAALGQSQSPDKLLESLAAVEKHYRNYMALANGEDYRNPAVAERYGIARGPNEATPKTLATGSGREEQDPALQGVNSHIRSMIKGGRSAADIVNYANSIRAGLGDQVAGQVDAAVRFRAQNPRVPVEDYTISVENRMVPMSDLRQRINDVAQTPGGAYLMNVGDMLTMGTLDNMQENPALARAGMAAIREKNPTSSMLGTLTGGVIAGGLGEGALSAAGRFAPLLADAALGAGYGAGSADEGSRLGGAGWGTVSGVAGGVLGRGVTSRAGRALRGVQNESARLLRERGVPLTIGQIRAGAAKAAEDRLMGYGGVGDRIANQRRAGIEAFNRAAFDEALEPLGQARVAQVGEQGVDSARNMISGPGGAYERALAAVSLTPDAQFTADVGGALARGSGLARTGPEFSSWVDNSIAPHFSAPNGQIGGRQVQDIIQQARGANFGTDSMGSLASDAARDIEGAVMDLAGRQAPGSMEALGNANTAYRNLNILSDAVGRGMNTGGRFTPAQLGMAARANTTRFGGKIAAATPGRPFFDLQRAGQEVLPSTVPDSGTAGRLAEQGGLFGGLRRMGRNAKGALLYNDSLQEPISKLLLDRTPEQDILGEWLLNHTRTGGLIGRALVPAYGPLSVRAP
jgi:hypothetical protein